MPKSIRLSGRVALFLVVLLGATWVVGPQVAAPATPTVPPNALGRFVGYNITGHPHSVSAEWRVPSISDSSEAHASTWIGLQSESGAFIQVGTLEDSFPGYVKSAPLGVAEKIPQRIVYSGFWSGDAELFHPKSTFSEPVLPGDLIAASISKMKHGGWRLQLVDSRDQARFVKTIKMDNAVLTEAEWIQEDPTNLATDGPLPYPHLSPVRWTKVMLNGRPPTLDLADEAWMSVPGRDFAPTSLAGDGFKVVPVRLNVVQTRWVTARDPYEQAAYTFDIKQGAWRTHPPTSTMATAELRPFLAALKANERVLSSQQWPSVPEPDINRLVAAYDQDGVALVALANAEPRPSESVVAQLDEARIILRSTEKRVANDLSLP